ncbi:hypothetical protein EFL95_14995 [Nocardioides marmorisolisilvae]|uniref:Uncharacterized protein n=1 Tax=Nocardioides marmorisolisilvae TaxID=1542737 RepID=A0A3N0DX58_9ACTN|nr:hypothetical protein EFL95_14995 [Nocardioides marmorisolisilvae]
MSGLLVVLPLLASPFEIFVVLLCLFGGFLGHGPAPALVSFEIELPDASGVKPDKGAGPCALGLTLEP